MLLRGDHKDKITIHRTLKRSFFSVNIKQERNFVVVDILLKKIKGCIRPDRQTCSSCEREGETNR